MKEIQKHEKEFLIEHGYIKLHTFDCPVYDNNGIFLGTAPKSKYKDLVITSLKKSGKQKYYTLDDLVEKLRAGKLV